MKAGTKVHYIAFKGCDNSLIENGFIKSKGNLEHTYFVVYHWSDDPKNYMNYTGACTHIRDIKLGWVNKTAIK